jgi:hypothetical protein
MVPVPDSHPANSPSTSEGGSVARTLLRDSAAHVALQVEALYTKNTKTKKRLGR